MERGGVARSFHVDGTSAADVVPFLRANVAREAKLVTDDAGQYRHVAREFPQLTALTNMPVTSTTPTHQST